MYMIYLKVHAMRTSMISLLEALILVAGTTATIICNGCPSLDLQRTPGIGIDLTLAYGTASINFENGTIHNVAKINGSPKYIAAMKALVADSLPVSRNESTKLPTLEFSTTGRPVSLFPLGIPFLNPRPQLSSDPQVIAIKPLLLELKTAISATTLLSYPYIYLSYPDTIANVNTHRGRFDTAAEEVGFDVIRASGSSRSALYDHDIRCHGLGENGNETCVGELCDSKISVVLAVSLTEESFETAILTRTHDTWAIWGSSRTTIDVGLGMTSLQDEDKDSYWWKVKAIVKGTLEAEDVDRVMLLGEHWENEDLIRNLQEAVTEIAIVAGLNDRPFEHMVLSASSGLWSAARGSAMAAKGLLFDHLDGCMPDEACERIQYHGEL